MRTKQCGPCIAIACYCYAWTMTCNLSLYNLFLFYVFYPFLIYFLVKGSLSLARNRRIWSSNMTKAQLIIGNDHRSNLNWIPMNSNPNAFQHGRIYTEAPYSTCPIGDFKNIEKCLTFLHGISTHKTLKY